MQILWNSFMGIPIGLILSAIAAKGEIPQILHIVNPTINVTAVTDVRFWVFLLAAIFSFATTLASTNKPIKLAKDCSPIESLNFIFQDMILFATFLLTLLAYIDGNNKRK